MWWRSHFLLDARNLWRAFCVKCHEGDANNWQYCCCCISKNEEKGWADIHYYTYTINISRLKSGKNLKKKKNQHFLTNGGHRHFWQIWIQRHLKPLWLSRTTLAWHGGLFITTYSKYSCISYFFHASICSSSYILWHFSGKYLKNGWLTFLVTMSYVCILILSMM